VISIALWILRKRIILRNKEFFTVRYLEICDVVKCAENNVCEILNKEKRKAIEINESYILEQLKYFSRGSEINEAYANEYLLSRTCNCSNQLCCYLQSMIIQISIAV
jgi:hypothetical protein